MRISHYGPCGLFCYACPDKECPGCGGEAVDQHVRNCFFRKCSQDKKLEFCSYCDEYPCVKLNEFMHDEWPHHRPMEGNSAYIRELGKDKWLEAQSKIWSCQRCGAETKWYQHSCSCGESIDGWEPPDSWAPPLDE